MSWIEVSAELAIDGAAVSIGSLVARSPAGDVRLNGRVGFADAGSYGLEYDVRFDIGALQAWWPNGPSARGRIAAHGAITGALASPLASFDLTADDLAWSAIANGHFEAKGQASASAIVLDACALRADAIDVHGTRAHRSRGWRGAKSVRSDSGVRRVCGAFAPLVGVAPAKLPLLPASGTMHLTWDRAVPTLATLAGDLRVDVREPGAGPLTLDGRAGRWNLEYEHVLDGATRAELHLETSLRADDVLRSPLRGSLEVHSENVAAAMRHIRAADVAIPTSFDAVIAGRVAMRGAVVGSIGEPAANIAIDADGCVGRRARRHSCGRADVARPATVVGDVACRGEPRRPTRTARHCRRQRRPTAAASSTSASIDRQSSRPCCRPNGGRPDACRQKARGRDLRRSRTSSRRSRAKSCWPTASSFSRSPAR